MKKATKRLFSSILAISLCLSSGISVFATEQVEFSKGTIVSSEDEKSFGPTLGYEGGSDSHIEKFIIPITPGKGKYSLKNISKATFNLVEPLTDYLENKEYADKSTWPSVTCEKGDGFTVSADINPSIKLSAVFIWRIGFYSRWILQHVDYASIFVQRSIW